MMFSSSERLRPLNELVHEQFFPDAVELGIRDDNSYLGRSRFLISVV